MSDQGPQYADDQGRKGERIGALVTATSLAGLILLHHVDVRSVRVCAALIFPLAAIWFADELAESVSRGSGHLLSPLQAPTALRAAGWFCFGGCLLLLIAIW